MNDEGLTAALDSCGGDILTAIQQLNGLHLDQEAAAQHEAPQDGERLEQPQPSLNDASSSMNGAESSTTSPGSAAEWVEAFVQQMAASQSIDDARGRAANLLGAFEQFVNSNKQTQADEVIRTLNVQLEKCTQENTILKKAVTIQHTRNVELQEALKTAELNNYSLSVHLKQMDSKPGNFMNNHVC
jgi:hypothetical protein